MYEDLAIVVHTMDKYDFCWDGWYKTFTKHWDLSLGIDIYFANEEKDIPFKEFKQLKTGKNEWSERLKIAFNSIPHKHIIYWQEDMWMIDQLKDFPQYYKDFIKYDMDYLMFMTDLRWELNTYFKYEKEICDGKYLKQDVENTKWVIFHQPAIWKKDFFLKYLHHNEDPWVNEIEATKRAREDNKTTPVNTYNVQKLTHWYVPVCHRGKLRDYADDVKNGTFKKLTDF